LVGTFIVAEIKDSGAIRLAQLDGIIKLGWVNGPCLKAYVSTT